MRTRGGVIGLERKFNDINMSVTPGPNSYRPNDSSVRPESVQYSINKAN